MYIGGIASGIDTEAFIETMLAIERRPMVQMQARKDLLGRQREAWRDINTRLNNLRERIGELRNSSIFHQRAAVSSNEAALTVTATRRAAEANYDIEVVALAQAHRVGSGLLDLNPEGGLGLSGTVALNGVNIELGEVETLDDLAAAINESPAGVRATVVPAELDPEGGGQGYLVLRAEETGVANKIEFGGEDVWRQLGFVDNAGEYLNELTAAQDAQLKVEGVDVTRSSNTIDDLFEGIVLTLHGAGEANVIVERDFDRVVDAVKAFVEQYNSVRSFMENATRSNENSEQRGVLSGDSMAQRIQSQLRTELMGSVGGDPPFNNLMSIGISVDRYGVMTLDESKLRDALAEDAGAVEKLFSATEEEDEFNGVAVRLEATFQTWLQQNTGLLAERQKMFGNQIRSIDESMERLEQRLEMREQSLLRQLVQLERVMAQFQAQSMWLDGQLQQLNGMTGARR